MQLVGNPLYDEIVTGQVTMTGAAVAVGTAKGLRLLWIMAHASNAADDVVYGPSGVAAGTGMPLPKGIRVLVALSDLTRLFAVGTAGGVVCWEGYR